MGKQSKRRRRHHRTHCPSLAGDDNEDDNNNNPSSNNNNNNNNNNDKSSDKNTKEHPLIAKLRHGDPPTRHATLVALSRLPFDSSLLRCLSERILDSDIPCAIVAAGCLSNHVSHPDSDLSDMSYLPPILMRRISSCKQRCESTVDEAALKEAWHLQSLSLSVFAGLIESSPTTITMDLSLLTLLMDVLQSGLTAQHDDQVAYSIENATRALHSLLDDNPDLVESIPDTAEITMSVSVISMVGQLENISTDARWTTLARLHASGAILSLQRLRTRMGSDMHAALTSNFNVIVPNLLSFLSIPNNSTNSIHSTLHPKKMVQRIIHISQHKSRQKMDEDMESQIVQEVNARKEPARSIARRQKDTKLNHRDTNTESNAQEDTHNWDEELETILRSWRDQCESYRLALELIANLCSPSDDSDDESMSESQVDEEILVSLSSHQALDRILQFFQAWIAFLPEFDNDDDAPEAIKHDVHGLLHTCALCLGNMLSTNLSTPSELQRMWLVLAPLLSSGSDVPLVMLSMLRHHAVARSWVDAPMLDALLKLLLQDGEEEPGVRIQCHVIAMLGILCEAPHSSSVNERICTSLLERLRALSPGLSRCSAGAMAVTNEVCNVLMDMYADDDNEEVFGGQDVLGHLRRGLPGFKRGLKRMEGGEEWEDWSETALNVSRFIEFKR